MSELPEDLEVKTAVEASEVFCNTYYQSLGRPSALKDLHTFYVKLDPNSPLKPDISLNGTLVPDPAGLAAIFEKQPPKTHYEFQSFDCHVLNANYNVGAPDAFLELNKAGKKISIAILVNGSVKYGEAGDVQGFTDNIVLVPNWEVYGKVPKGKRKWLVQTQKFRVVA